MTPDITSRGCRSVFEYRMKDDGNKIIHKPFLNRNHSGINRVRLIFLQAHGGPLVFLIRSAVEEEKEKSKGIIQLAFMSQTGL